MTQTKFWEVSPGNQSSQRLAFLIKSAWNMFICTVLIFRGIDPLVMVAVFIAIEGAIGSQKIVQFHKEKTRLKGGGEDNDPEDPPPGVKKP